MTPSIEKGNVIDNNHMLTAPRISRSRNEKHLDPVHDGDILFRNGLRNLGNTCFLNSAVQMLFSLENGLIEDLLYPCGNNSDISSQEKEKCNNIKYEIPTGIEDHCVSEEQSQNRCSSDDDRGKREDPSHMYYCCGEFPIPEELATLLCWPGKQAGTELTAEQEEENAKELRDALVQIGKKLMHTDTCARAVDPTPIKKAIDAKTRQFAGYQQHDSHEFFTTMLDLLSDEEKENELGEHSIDEPTQGWQQAIEVKKDNKKSVVDLHFSSHVKVTLVCSKCSFTR